MKSKKLYLSIIFTLVLAVGFSMIAPSNNSNQNVYAATNIGQTTSIDIDKLGTYYLYPNNNNVSSICNNFSYIADGNYWQQKTDELYHYYKGRMKITDETTKFKSMISLSEALVKAGNNGVLNVKASAYYASEYGGKIWFVDDDKDELRMNLNALNSDLSVLKNVNKDYTSYDYQSSPQYLGIDQFNGSKIQLVFEELNGKVTYEIMRVKQPTLYITSIDTIAPTINLSDNSNYVNKRVLTITADDSGAGVNYLTINGNVIQSSSSSDDSKSKVFTYEIEENGIYNIACFDNVGNQSTCEYVESKIDKVSPSTILVSGLENLYFTKTISFNAEFTISSDNCADEFYVYTIDGTEPTITSNKLVNGKNLIAVDQNNLYTLKVKSFDMAGNETITQTFETRVDDNYYSINIESGEGGEVSPSIINLRYSDTPIISFNATSGYEFYYLEINGQKVETTNGQYQFNISENYNVYVAFRKIISVSLTCSAYIWTGNNIEIEYQANINSLDLINFNYFKENIQTNFCEVGNYEIRYFIDTDLYIGSGVLNATISNKQKAFVSLTTTSYVYSTQDFVLDYNSNVDANDIIFTYYLNGELVEPKDVGHYMVNYSVDTDSYIGNAVLEFDIVKKEIEIVASLKTYTYNHKVQIFEVSNGLNLNMTATFYQNDTKVSFENAGDYDYIIVIDDENYCGELTGKVSIQRKEINISFGNEKFVYNGENQEPSFVVEDNHPYNKVLKQNNEIIQSSKNSGNYCIELNVDEPNFYAAKSFEYEISTREIVVKADKQKIIYGQNLPLLTYTINNDIKSDNLSFETNVENYSGDYGVYNIVIAKKSLDNYTITYQNAVLTVDKKDIHITLASDNSKIYGENDPEIRYEVNGQDIVNNDVLVFTINREIGESVGLYAIESIIVDNENYNVIAQTFSFKITKRKIVLKIDSKSKIYGENDPAFTYSIMYGNLVFEDNFDNSLIRESGENVGKYTISVNTNFNTNYDVLYLSNTLEILQREALVVPTQITTTYGEDKPLTYSVVLLDGDVLSGSLDRQQGQEVGEYLITLGSLCNQNYKLNIKETKYIIEKSDLQVIVDNINTIYGLEKELTYSVAGLKYQDNIELKLTREEGTDVGEYEIYSTINEHKNYNLIFNNASYVIGKKDVVLTFKANQSKTFGENEPQYKFITDVSVNIEIETTRDIGENVGEYLLKVNSTNIKNYNIIITENQYFRINKANKVLTLKNKEVIYDGLEQKLEIEGNEKVSYTYKFNGIEIEEPVDCGDYMVVASYSGDENYNASQSNVAVLTIKKKSVYITVEKDCFIYDGTAKLPTFTVSNDCVAIVNMDELNSIEIGDYDFEIIVDEQNYYGSITGILKIIEAPKYVSDAGNEVCDMYGDLVLSNASVELNEDNSNDTLGKLNANLSGKKAMKSYSFFVNGEPREDATVVIRLLAPDTTGLSVYLYNSSNEMKEVGYKIEDNFIVFEVSDLSLNFVVAKTVNNPSWLLYVAIGGGTVLAGIIAWIAIKMYIFAKKATEKSSKKQAEKVATENACQLEDEETDDKKEKNDEINK